MHCGRPKVKPIKRQNWNYQLVPFYWTTQKYISNRIIIFVSEYFAKPQKNLNFTRSYTADAVLYRQPSGQPTNTVMLNSNWLRVEEVSWQWSVGRLTVPRLSTWYDVTWYDMDVTWRGKMWHDVTWHYVIWHDLTWRAMTWHEVHHVAWLDMTWHDVKWHNAT